MRMSGNGEGGQIFREDSQQVDSEPENNLDFSSSESDESDDADNYPFPFEGEADHYFFKFGGEKDFVTSAMTLPTTNQMQAKSTNASLPRNLQLNGNNSDSEMRRVPEMSGKANPTSAKVANGPSSQSRKRGGASADKEHKRMKRLLRNRVSAQQARERKKAYLSELEMKSKELEQKNAELQERISTLERENYMLRQIVKNTTLKNAEVHQ